MLFDVERFKKKVEEKRVRIVLCRLSKEKCKNVSQSNVVRGIPQLFIENEIFWLFSKSIILEIYL